MPCSDNIQAIRLSGRVYSAWRRILCWLSSERRLLDHSNPGSLAYADGDAGRPILNFDELVRGRDAIDAYAGAYLSVGIGTRFFEAKFNQQSSNIHVHWHCRVPPCLIQGDGIRPHHSPEID